MSYPQATMGWLGGPFWPVGDVYSTTPIWSEWHSPQGLTIFESEEQNRFSLVARYSDQDASFIIRVEDEAGVPVGVPEAASRVVQRHGFQEEKSFGIFALTDELGDWTGELQVVLNPALQKWIGVGNVVDFVIDFWTDYSPTEKNRIAYGELVLRR